MTLLVQDKCKSIDDDYIQYDCASWIEYTETIEESDGYQFIHSPKHRLAIPHVVVLTAYDKLPRNQVKYSRESLFQRDKYTCAYCGDVFKKNKLTIDHINPKSVGGTKSWRNTITACRPCNEFKANRTPDEANMPLLFQPSEPSWFQQIQNMAAKITIKPQWEKYLDSFIVKEKDND